MRLALSFAAIVALTGTQFHFTPSSLLPVAAMEDYRRSAGTRYGDTLHVTLDVREVLWKPYGNRGGTVSAYTFVERGTQVRVPGPLVRVTAGTVIRATFRNELPVPLAVLGMQDHPAGPIPDSLMLAPAAEGVVTFKATSAGSYYYWGRVRPPGKALPGPGGFVAGGQGAEGPLVGALIVDRAGEPPPRGERILMLTRWFDGKYANIDTAGSWKIMVNGGSWPNTERLEYAVGDTVRWRVLNPMGIYHPMHLHGFYFDVTARGDGRLDTLYTPEQRRPVVTELMPSFGTMSLAWVPERPGNWLFHCHLIRHMAMPQYIQDTSSSTAHNHLAKTAVSHAEDHMAGLVMGVHVRPAKGRTGVASLSRATGKDRAVASTRRMRLVATTKPNVYGEAPGYAFILQEGARAPLADSLRFPGSTLTLRRGEPTQITVVNLTGTPLAVHWHGMEIESWYDGVGGWSGAGTSVRPPIAAGDSFAVRMTPPRSGTFIYHTHDETGDQLAAGLYGALLVLDPGTTRDTTRDHLLVLGLRGRASTGAFTVNGEKSPGPLLLSPDAPNRLRFVSIPPNERFFVDLMRTDGTAQQWIPLAVDGADLPAHQRAARPARFVSSAGQAFDMQVRLDSAALASGQYSLRFRTVYYPSPRRPDTTMMAIGLRR
jgi:manganese oxidase